MKNKMKNTLLTLTYGIFIILSLITLSSALIVDSVSMNPDEISPGKTSVIRMGLENNGDNDIEDVTISLDLTGILNTGMGSPIVYDMPFAPYNSASEFNIDEISDGKTKYAEFEIIALNNAKSGIYKVPVEITYKEGEDSVEKTKNSLISITVNSEPIIDINVGESLLLKNQENELIIKITNKGLSDVKFLEIEIDDSVYFRKLSSENIYIGDVDSDDFDTAEFNIYFKENSVEKINLPITIKYKDVLNKEYAENLNVELNVYSREKAVELGLLKEDNNSKLIIGAISFLILFIIYRKLKKRKKS